MNTGPGTHSDLAVKIACTQVILENVFIWIVMCTEFVRRDQQIMGIGFLYYGNER